MISRGRYKRQQDPQNYGHKESNLQGQTAPLSSLTLLGFCSRNPMHLDFQILPLLLRTFVNLTGALMLDLLALLSFDVWDLLQHRMIEK